MTGLTSGSPRHATPIRLAYPCQVNPGQADAPYLIGSLTMPTRRLLVPVPPRALRTNPSRLPLPALAIPCLDDFTCPIPSNATNQPTPPQAWPTIPPKTSHAVPTTQANPCPRPTGPSRLPLPTHP